MTHLVVDGLIGLWLGASLHALRLDRADAARETLSLRRRGERKALLWAAGAMAALTALLMWLAVIDVDEIPLLPLNGSLLLGGAVCGLSLGLTGFTPLTALAGIGGGRFTESLCALLGAGLAWLILPWARNIAAGADGWFPQVEATFFQVTLDKPFLLGGGFLAQGCVGLLLFALAIAVRGYLPPEKAALPPPPPAEPQEEIPAEPVSIEPETVQEETIVVALPGEEPVVVDTEDDSPAEDAPLQNEEKPGQDH